MRKHTGARRLRQSIRVDTPIRLIVGSERLGTPSGWIETDIEYLNLLEPADWARFFAPNSIAAILAEHVWEHLDANDGLRAARTCHHYLRPGGYLRVAVPDGFHPDPSYRAAVQVGGSGPGAHDHRVLYTHDSMRTLMTTAGFDVELLEYFDCDGAFHAKPWAPDDGMIRRSRRFDARNQDGQLRYTSLIVDARKTA